MYIRLDLHYVCWGQNSMEILWWKQDLVRFRFRFSFCRRRQYANFDTANTNWVNKLLNFVLSSIYFWIFDSKWINVEILNGNYRCSVWKCKRGFSMHVFVVITSIMYISISVRKARLSTLVKTTFSVEALHMIHACYR
jgi:hypothetical protein